MAIVAVVNGGIFGLRFVSSTGVGTLVIPQDLVTLQTPPSLEDLMEMTRNELMAVVRGRFTNIPSNATKQRLCDIIAERWQVITESYAQEYAQRHNQDVIDVFGTSTAHWRSIINGLFRGEDEGEAQVQPHQQPPLPVGWQTEPSITTEAVLASPDLEEFVKDDAEVPAKDDAEIPSGSGDFIPFDPSQLDGTDLNNPESGTHYTNCVLPVRNGSVKFRYHFDSSTKVNDLLEELQRVSGDKFVRESFNVKIGDGGSELQHFDSLLSYINSGDTLTVNVRLQGGGKRGRQDKTAIESTMNIKELRSHLNNILGQLGNPQSPVVGEITQKITTVIEKCKDEPSGISLSLFQNIGAVRVGKLCTVTSACSTRVHDRLKFVAEQIFEEELLKVESLRQQVSLTEDALVQTVYLILLSAFSDPSGSLIKWQDFVKSFTDMLAKPPVANNDGNGGNNCIVM